MKRTTVDLWVGLLVVGGLVALLALALKVGNASTVTAGQGYKLTADFNNIGGLKPRAPVKSAGVVVGRVESIAFDNKKFLARVTLLIDKTYEFPKDSNASILTSGLLGEQYIGLDGGGDDAVLKDGDRITLTQSALVLEQMIGRFLTGKAGEGPTAGKDQ